MRRYGNFWDLPDGGILTGKGTDHRDRQSWTFTYYNIRKAEEVELTYEETHARWPHIVMRHSLART